MRSAAKGHPAAVGAGDAQTGRKPEGHRWDPSAVARDRHRVSLGPSQPLRSVGCEYPRRIADRTDVWAGDREVGLLVRPRRDRSRCRRAGGSRLAEVPAERVISGQEEVGWSVVGFRLLVLSFSIIGQPCGFLVRTAGAGRSPAGAVGAAWRSQRELMASGESAGLDRAMLAAMRPMNIECGCRGRLRSSGWNWAAMKNG